MRDFDEWLTSFRPSINNYNYYVNFEKVINNVEKYKVELNILNSLIGSENIEVDFDNLIQKYPEVLRCIPILLAIRSYEVYAQDSDGAFLYNFLEMNYEPKQYLVFMQKTGLLGMLKDKKITNLVDYVIGIETGLDSNGRKNRGGHQMENLVETYIQDSGVEYYKEMYLEDIEEKWDLDLSKISADGTSSKRWDFVVKTPEKVYMIETNFYASGGSKLNETARSYKMISEDAKQVDGVEFVWLTDGAGWRSARRNLKETFDTMEHIYNIKDMENEVFLDLFR